VVQSAVGYIVQSAAVAIESSLRSDFSSESGREYRKEFGYDNNRAGGLGHHPVSAGGLVGLDISPEMGKVFGATSIRDIEKHGPHPTYDKLINAELRSWSQANNIDLSKATADHGRQFLRHISNVPEIFAYNQKLMQEAMAARRAPHSRVNANRAVGAAAAWTGVIGLQDHVRANDLRQCMRIGC
jgi:hypothetical protein